jgi:hypothetical protein
MSSSSREIDKTRTLYLAEAAGTGHANGNGGGGGGGARNTSSYLLLQNYSRDRTHSSSYKINVIISNRLKTQGHLFSQMINVTYIVKNLVSSVIPA